MDGGWTNHGQKQRISLGIFAKVALIFAQTDPEQKYKGIAGFLVPTDIEGLTTRRSTASSACGARRPPSCRWTRSRHPMGDARRGRGRLQGRDERVRLGALQRGCRVRGDLPGSVNASVDYSKEREQFGRPIAAFQLVRR